MKQLFIYFKDFMFNPNKAWQDIANSKNVGVKSSKYAHLLIVICSISALLGKAINSSKVEWVACLHHCILIAISLLVGFYLSIFIISLVYEFVTKDRLQHYKVTEFVAFAFSSIFATCIISEFFPKFFIVHLLNLYTLYIVWEACSSYLTIEKAKKTIFVLLTSAAIIVSPIFIKWLFIHIMPGIA